MASAYAQTTYGIKNPKVGLLNNGTEDHKGLALHQETNALLKELDCVNYVGNREGRDIMYGDVDVMVADGFTGNLSMKAIEGCAKAISNTLKKEYKKNPWRILCGILSMGVINGIKNSFDYEGVGGAMFLGLNKAVVKAHGNSKARGFAAAIMQAANAVRGDMTGKIKQMIDSVDLESIQARAQEANAQ